jgi:transcriptional regulator of heat shock response
MLQRLENNSLKKAIEIVESLTNEDQEELVKIIQNRLKEKRKKELLEAVEESRQAFIKGEVKTGSIADLMWELDAE